MTQTTIFWLWVVALTAALFYPVSRLVLVVSVRRLQKKLQRHLDETELHGQNNRAYFLAIVVSFIFSMMFNYRLLG